MPFIFYNYIFRILVKSKTAVQVGDNHFNIIFSRMATRVNRLKRVVQRVSLYLESSPNFFECPDNQPDYVQLQGALREIPPICQDDICATSRTQMESKLRITPHAYSPDGYQESPAFHKHRHVFNSNYLFRRNSAQFPKLVPRQLCSKSIKDVRQREERDVRDNQFLLIRQFIEEKNGGFLRQGHSIEDWSERFLDNVRLVNAWIADMPTLIHFCMNCMQSPYIAALFTLRYMIERAHKVIGPECKLEDKGELSLLVSPLFLGLQFYAAQTKFMSNKMKLKLAAQKQELQRLEYNLRFQQALNRVVFILPAVRNELRDMIAHKMTEQCSDSEYHNISFDWYLRNKLGEDFEELQQQFQAIRAQGMNQDLSPVIFRGQKAVQRNKKKCIKKRRVRHSARGRPKQFTKVLPQNSDLTNIFKKRVSMTAAALRRQHNLPKQTPEQKKVPIKLHTEIDIVQRRTANDIIRQVAMQRTIKKCIQEGRKAQLQSKATDKTRGLSKISQRLDQMAAERVRFNRFDETLMIMQAKKMTEQKQKQLQRNITSLSKLTRIRTKNISKPIEVKTGNNGIISKP